MAEFDQPLPLPGEAELAAHASCNEAISRVEAERDEARRHAAAALRQLESFKQRVRETAIEVHKEQEWCREGLNERLEQLGLDPYSPTFCVTALVTVTGTVEADDRNAAQSAFTSNLRVDTQDEDQLYDLDVSEVTVRHLEAGE